MEKMNQKSTNETNKKYQIDEAEKIEQLKNHETAVRYRVQCEERAFRIVNKLIDDAVENSYLIQCGQMISREHYGDIVEERAISLLCGYPICRNNLGNIPKKKYHISTRSNKVYDISERKNFCSNQCLQASKHFQNQISESPIWARAKEKPVEFQILPKSSIKGVVGDEVVGINPRTVLEEEVSSLDDKQEPNTKSTSSAKLSQNIPDVTNKHSNMCVNNVNKNSSAQEKSEVHSDDKKDNSDVCIEKNENITLKLDHLSIDESVAASSESEVVANDRKTTDNSRLESKKLICSRSETVSKLNDDPYKSVTSDNRVIPLLSDDLKEKLSQKESIGGEDKMQRLLMLMSRKKKVLSEMADVQSLVVNEQAKQISTSEKPDLIKAKTKQTHSVKENANRKSKSSQPATLSPLCILSKILKRWITHRTIEYLKTTDQLSQSRDLPSFSDPKVQAGYADLCRRLGGREKEMDTLIKETVGESDTNSHQPNRTKGRLPDYEALKKEVETFLPKASEFITGKRAKDRVIKETPEPNDVYIPTVDAYDQHQIRIRIVLDRLDKSLSELLNALRLTVQDVSQYLRELIHTFCLEKDTIVFKPFEWTLVGLFILKMLSQKLPSISAAFSQASAQRYFTTLLQGIGHSMEDLDREVQELVSSPHEDLK